MILNYIEYEFINAVGIDYKDGCYHAIKDNEIMKLVITSNVRPRKTNEATDFSDGTSNNKVFTSSNYVLNIATKQNGRKEFKEIRVVNNNMLYTMKETFVGTNNLKEVAITAGEYDKDDQVIVKVKLKDRFQPDVFMKTYIMRPGLSYSKPCYIDCTKKSSRLYDVGSIVGHYLEESVTSFYKTTSNDYLFLLKKCIDYSYLFPNDLKDLFKGMLVVFESLYKLALDRYKEQAPIENPDIIELRRKIDGYEKRMNHKFREALNKRLAEPDLSEIEKLDIKRQYDRWLKEFQQELQIDVRTIFELPCEENEIQRNK